ncbi:hypothetical protein [Streptosporangium jomthongense]|uniref:Hydrolase n=1 Tax=Streptosporangium jomthongense TaxID=1193683 RepID=A0ABV8F4A0_9ACTN
MIRVVVFDIGETLVRDDRYWASWADWLGVSRHTLSALVGAVTAMGLDNAEAIRLLRPGADLHAERRAREEAGRGEFLDESDLYPDVRPGFRALREAGVRVCVAGNQTVRAGDLVRGLGLPADEIGVSEEWGWRSRTRSSSDVSSSWAGRHRRRRFTWGTIRPTTSFRPGRRVCGRA